MKFTLDFIPYSEPFRTSFSFKYDSVVQAFQAAREINMALGGGKFLWAFDGDSWSTEPRIFDDERGTFNITWEV